MNYSPPTFNGSSQQALKPITNLKANGGNKLTGNQNKFTLKDELGLLFLVAGIPLSIYIYRISTCKTKTDCDEQKTTNYLLLGWSIFVIIMYAAAKAGILEVLGEFFQEMLKGN